MPRVVTCPVARWPGEVVLAEPMSWPQFLAWQRAVMNAEEVAKAEGLQSEYDAAICLGIAAVVLEWRLGGLNPPDAHGVPATPRHSSNEFISWFLREVFAIVKGEASTDPKALEP